MKQFKSFCPTYACTTPSTQLRNRPLSLKVWTHVFTETTSLNNHPPLSIVSPTQRSSRVLILDSSFPMVPSGSENSLSRLPTRRNKAETCSKIWSLVSAWTPPLVQASGSVRKTHPDKQSSSITCLIRYWKEAGDRVETKWNSVAVSGSTRGSLRSRDPEEV